MAKRLVSLMLVMLLLAPNLLVYASEITSARNMSIFKISGSEDGVKVQRKTKTVNGAEGFRLSKDDEITTDSATECRLQVDDDKVVYVAKNSKIAVSTVKKNALSLSLISGEAYVQVSNSLDADSSLSINAGGSVMGVRGTQFHVSNRYGDMKVNVTSGSVDLKTVVTHIVLNPGTTTTVNPDGKIAKQTTISVDELSSFALSVMIELMRTEANTKNDQNAKDNITELLGGDSPENIARLEAILEQKMADEDKTAEDLIATAERLKAAIEAGAKPVMKTIEMAINPTPEPTSAPSTPGSSSTPTPTANSSLSPVAPSVPPNNPVSEAELISAFSDPSVSSINIGPGVSISLNTPQTLNASQSLTIEGTLTLNADLNVSGTLNNNSSNTLVLENGDLILGNGSAFHNAGTIRGLRSIIVRGTVNISNAADMTIPAISIEATGRATITNNGIIGEVSGTNGASLSFLEAGTVTSQNYQDINGNNESIEIGRLYNWNTAAAKWRNTNVIMIADVSTEQALLDALAQTTSYEYVNVVASITTTQQITVPVGKKLVVKPSGSLSLGGNVVVSGGFENQGVISSGGPFGAVIPGSNAQITNSGTINSIQLSTATSSLTISNTGTIGAIDGVENAQVQFTGTNAGFVPWGFYDYVGLPVDMPRTGEMYIYKSVGVDNPGWYNTVNHINSMDALMQGIDDAPTDGSPTILRLEQELSVDNTVEIPAGANITLMSMENEGPYALTRPDSTAYTMIEVQNGGSLILSNIVLDGNKANNANQSKLLYVNAGSVSINQGTVIKDQIGSGVDIDGGTLTMNDGTITGCDNQYTEGAGVHLQNGAIFTMSGGSITGNTATAGLGGAGVYVQLGTFNMSGGNITNNDVSMSSSLGYGGGVYVNRGNTFTMTGGTISGNSAKEGGGVYIDAGFGNPGVYDMRAGTLSGNTASFRGNGICMKENSTLNFSGGYNIMNNDIYMEMGTLIKINPPVSIPANKPVLLPYASPGIRTIAEFDSAVGTADPNYFILDPSLVSDGYRLQQNADPYKLDLTD